MSKVFFQNKNCTLYNGSCFSALKKINDKTIDFIFADPPYFLSGNGITCQSGKMASVNKGKWDEEKSLSDKISFSKKWIKECYRILKDEGTIMISGTFHSIHIIGMVLEQVGFKIINNITWIKSNPPPNLSCKCFVHSTETILWAKKHTASKYNFNYSLMKKLNNNKQMKDVWIINRPKKSEKKFGNHPTQKPLELLDRIILSTCKVGDIVLDPFIGSGTTAVASLNHKCKCIGIDNNKDYLEIAKKRILSEEVHYEEEF